MIRTTILAIILVFSVELILAQELKYPLADKETKVVIPESPGKDYSWVKAHWEFINGKYEWITGKYIENLEFHAWQDGYWERNQKTGWWVYNPGYWQRVKGGIGFTGPESFTTEVSQEPIEKKSVYINMSGMAEK